MFQVLCLSAMELKMNVFMIGLNNEISISLFYPVYIHKPFAAFYWSAAFIVTIRLLLNQILGFTRAPRGTKSLFQEANKLLVVP